MKLFCKITFAKSPIVDSDQVLNTPLYHLLAKVRRISKKRSMKSSFSLKLSDNLKIVAVLYYRNRSIIQRDVLNNNTSQVIQLDSSNCKFREALIAPEIGLFHRIRLFYPRNPNSYAVFCLSARPILCELNCYVVKMT